MSLYLFDVDGTLVRPASNNTFRQTADDWVYLPGVEAKCQQLVAAGHQIALVSNQGGVAYGIFQLADITAAIEATGAGVGAALCLLCPYHPKGKLPEFAVDSEHRKPKPGMLLEAMQRLGYAAADTTMVGDRDEDAQAAAAAGVSFIHANTFFGF